MSLQDDIDQLRKAIRENGPPEWTDAEREEYVEELVGVCNDGPLTARDFAHVVWTMGGTVPHPGPCRYVGGDEVHDGDDENLCWACEESLLAIGEDVIADLKKPFRV